MAYILKDKNFLISDLDEWKDLSDGDKSGLLEMFDMITVRDPNGKGFTLKRPMFSLNSENIGLEFIKMEERKMGLRSD